MGGERIRWIWIGLGGGEWSISRGRWVQVEWMEIFNNVTSPSWLFFLTTSALSYSPPHLPSLGPSPNIPPASGPKFSVKDILIASFSKQTSYQRNQIVSLAQSASWRAVSKDLAVRATAAQMCGGWRRGTFSVHTLHCCVQVSALDGIGSVLWLCSQFLH